MPGTIMGAGVVQKTRNTRVLLKQQEKSVSWLHAVDHWLLFQVWLLFEYYGCTPV